MASTTNVTAAARLRQKEVEVPPEETIAQPAAKQDTEYLAVLERLERAQERMLSAAIAFCDGLISAGQLRAVRELLREQERKIDAMGGIQASPFIGDVHDDSTPLLEEAKISAPEIEESVAVAIAEELSIEDITDPELRSRLDALDGKIARLEQDFQQGRINASQYRAIYRHYMGQREVAMRMRQTYPDSNRWQMVLEEGKTRFLLQLNEAACYSVGLYDIQSKTRIFVDGNMPESAEDAMALLGTFSTSEDESPDGRLFATTSDNGETLVLIPGVFTVSLAVFSQDPPSWQVRALREVHRNFEAANRPALLRGESEKLIFPDLSRFIKS
ncbi:MAG TPA: hypothetical protein VMX56_00195 [Anaerolineales bacterium]|nr:hypothetical protein [Anaerolineales bacterium]